MAYIKETTNAKGEKVFVIKISDGYTINGKQVTKSTTYKPAAGMTKRQIQKEVNRQAVLFEEKIKNGEISAKRRRKFESVANEWLEFARKTGELKTSTLELYHSCTVRTYNAIGHRFMDKITKKQLQDFIVNLSDGADGGKPLSYKSQKNYICFISNVFNYAIDTLELIKDSPCGRIQCAKTEEKPRQYYTLDESIDLFSALEEKHAPLKYQVFYKVCCYLGARKGEVLGLEWRDINFDRGTLFIQRTSNYRNKETGVYTSTTKTESSMRNLKIDNELLGLLHTLYDEQQAERELCGDLWQENDRVFRGEFGKPMFPNMPYNYLKKFCDREGLPFKALHSFRHSVATNLIHHGIDTVTVSNLLGHKNPNITLSVYSHEIAESTEYSCGMMAELISERKQKKNPIMKK